MAGVARTRAESMLHKVREAIGFITEGGPVGLEAQRMDNQLIPPEDIRVWVGPFKDEQEYLLSGQRMFGTLVNRYGLSVDDQVLDLGCGCGRIAGHILAFLSPAGRCTGMDCAPELLDWCKQNLAPRYANAEFVLSDVRSGAHHPESGGPATDYTFPFADGTFSFVFSVSLFTHMLIDAVRRYLCETARVTRPGSRFVSTYLLLNDRSMAGIRRGTAFRDMKYEVGKSRTFDEAVPEEGIAHPEDTILTFYRDCGFEVTGVEYGAWPEGKAVFPNVDQDTIVARRL